MNSFGHPYARRCIWDSIALAPQDDGNRSVDDDLPPLSRAIVRRQLTVIRFLLANGADVNGVDHSDYVKIPILVAADIGDVEIMKLLLDAGARIEAKNDLGLTPIMIATLRKNHEAVEFLLFRGCNVNATTRTGATALMMAARDKSLEIVKALVKAGADANTAADGGVTALMAAGDDPDIVEVLLSAGANMASADEQGWTVVCYALKEKQTKKLAALVKNGARADCRGKEKVR